LCTERTTLDSRVRGNDEARSSFKVDDLGAMKPLMARNFQKSEVLSGFEIAGG
jgi:hypothetical protein